MYKKLIIAFVSVFFFSQEQQAMFRSSFSLLKSSVTPFTKNFLKLADEIPFIENVQIISLLPIEKELEEKIYEMQNKGTLVKMILGASIYKNQKELIKSIDRRKSILACLPKSCGDLDWDFAPGHLGKGFEVKLLHGLNPQSKIQTALFFGESAELSAVLSREIEKENPEQIVESSLVIKNDPILKLLEDDFESILQAYRK